MFIFLLLIFLPLIEIVGFILIGEKIGMGLSLLWIGVSASIGFTMLTRGREKLVQRNISSLEHLFNNLCVIVGGLLLIFPGFISDFLALPLLLPPIRHLIFLFLRHRHAHILDDLEKTSEHFAYWNYRPKENGKHSMKTIEGDFKKLGDDKIY